MMFKNYIFDWSGTLVDDMGPTLEATNAVFQCYGKPTMNREEFRTHFRLPYSEFYAEYVPNVALCELEKHFREAFASSKVPVTILPHAREKLDWCQSHGIRCFILTSMDSATFEAQLDDLDLRHFFEATYSGIIDKRQLIRSILTTHNLNPQETAYFGDMVHDIETAKHGSVCSVALLTGYTKKPELLEANPDWLVADYAEFFQIIASQENKISV